MKIAEIKLSGWMAVLAIVGLAAFALMRRANLHQAFDESGRERVRKEIANIYLRYQLPLRKAALESGDAARIREVGEANKPIHAEDVRLDDVDARGSTDTLLVRVRYRIFDETPPDGVDVRYFRLRRSRLLGWTTCREVTSRAYKVAIF